MAVSTIKQINSSIEWADAEDMLATPVLRLKSMNDLIEETTHGITADNWQEVRGKILALTTGAGLILDTLGNDADRLVRSMQH